MNQSIYLYAISISFLKKSKRAKNYTRVVIGGQFMPICVLTRAMRAYDICNHRQTLQRIISDNKISGCLKGFKIEEVYSKKLISESFYYKLTDYDKEFKPNTNVEFT